MQLDQGSLWRELARDAAELELEKVEAAKQLVWASWGNEFLSLAAALFPLAF